PNPRVTAQQQRGSGNNSSTGDAIEFRNSRDSPRRFACRRAEWLQRKGLPLSGAAGRGADWSGAGFLGKTVPGAALVASAGPFRLNRAARLTNVSRHLLLHGYKI